MAEISNSCFLLGEQEKIRKIVIQIKSLRSEVKHLVASMLIHNLLHERRLLSIPKTLYLFFISEFFYSRNDTLFLVDVYGKRYVNRIKKLTNNTIVFDGIADVDKEQTYKR